MPTTFEHLIRDLRNELNKCDDSKWDKRTKSIINTKLEEAELFASRLEGYYPSN